MPLPGRDQDLDLSRELPRHHLDPAPLRRELHRVIHEVRENSFGGSGVSRDLRRIRRGLESDSARRGERLETARERLQQGRERKTKVLELSSSQNQIIAKQGAERLDFGETEFGFSAAGARFREGSQAKLDGDQRGLELVREKSREIDVGHWGYGRPSVARSLE
jgi:hypothetical protein